MITGAVGGAALKVNALIADVQQSMQQQSNFFDAISIGDLISTILLAFIGATIGFYTQKFFKWLHK